MGGGREKVRDSLETKDERSLRGRLYGRPPSNKEGSGKV